MFGDQYKGFADLGSDRPVPNPKLALLYIVAMEALLAVTLVSWLGWTWPALAVYAAIHSVAVAGWMYLRARSHRRQQEHRDALLEGDRWA